MTEPPIRYWHRTRQRLEDEVVYGERWLRWTYATLPGRMLLEILLKRAVFSRWYGWRMSRPGSRRLIAPFIKSYGIDMSSYHGNPDTYTSFNDFFIRRLRPGARPLPEDPNLAVLPADGRHLLLPVAGSETIIYAKNQSISLVELLGSVELAERFCGGTILISRLCPVDYHRFHFPVAGRMDSIRRHEGPLYSVNPYALRRRISYLWTNRRIVNLINTQDSIPVALVEIGATCVGSILHTHPADKPFQRGDEKGYFAFGGSCLVTVFPQGHLLPDADLVEQSARGIETYAWMGDSLGRLCASSVSPL